MTDQSRQVEDHITALREAREAIDRALAALDGGGSAAVDYAKPEWVNLATAAHYCGRHPDSTARIVRANGLGRRDGRDWRIDLNRVRAWQEGRAFPPLPPGPSDIVGHRGETSDVSREDRSHDANLKER